MSRITDLAIQVASEINESGLLPLGAKAEFCALLKRNVEDIKGLDVGVCPHSEIQNLVTRKTVGVEITVDVVIQFKLKAEKNEKVAAEYGVIADNITRFLDKRNVGLYRWKRTEYAPYHGESLEQYRVFASVISLTYYGQFKV